ncbi:MAG: M28 family peptidase [Armatimonadota bacterium]
MVIQSLLLGYVALTQTPETFDQARSWNWLTKQCALGPRTPGSEAHLKCRDMILEESKKYCARAELQPFQHRWTKTNKDVEMWNVLAFHNWDKAKVRVVLSAHWDTRPSADQEYDRQRAAKPIPGANDGASGVAVLLELMRLNKTLPEDIGICYAFFDGEDLGPELSEMFLGAVHYSNNVKSPKPDYGILLDMIGDKDLKVPVEPNSYKKAQKVTVALYRHAKKVGLEKTFPMEYGPEILDDHLSMNAAGIPTVDLIDFDYEHWHTLEDTPDKCSADSLGKVGKLLETWCRLTPAWKPK